MKHFVLKIMITDKKMWCWKYVIVLIIAIFSFIVGGAWIETAERIINHYAKSEKQAILYRVIYTIVTFILTIFIAIYLFPYLHPVKKSSFHHYPGTHIGHASHVSHASPHL